MDSKRGNYHSWKFLIFPYRAKSVIGIKGRNQLPSYTEADGIGKGLLESDNSASMVPPMTATAKATPSSSNSNPRSFKNLRNSVLASTTTTNNGRRLITTVEPAINSESVLEYSLEHTSEQPEDVREIEVKTIEDLPKRSHNIVGPLVAQFIR